MRPLFKTTIVIWSEFDPHDIDPKWLIGEAISGTCYCSKQEREKIADPEGDPDWQPTEFFDDPNQQE